MRLIRVEAVLFVVVRIRNIHGEDPAEWIRFNHDLQARECEEVSNAHVDVGFNWEAVRRNVAQKNRRGSSESDYGCVFFRITY